MATPDAGGNYDRMVSYSAYCGRELMEYDRSVVLCERRSGLGNGAGEAVR